MAETLVLRMKQLIDFLLRESGIACMVIEYHIWRLRSASALMKRFGSDTEMPVWCSERYRKHQSALRRLGFLCEREFVLTHRSVSGPNYVAFRDLARARFSDPCWSYAASGKRVIVTAPTSQLSKWQRFISEYDLQAA